MSAKTHPDFVPPWQDMPTLCAHICCTPNTVNSWVADGILPPPRKRGGKLMWKWSEVDEKLTLGTGQEASDPELEQMKHALRTSENRAGH